MNWRRVTLGLLSAGLGIFLIVALVKISKIDWRATLEQLRTVNWIAFSVLVGLNALLILLSTLKWRSIDVVLRRESDVVPSGTDSFAITSIGMAIGLVLPVSVGMTIARTLGTYSHGGALRRGAAGTLLEQGFDVLIVMVLAIASTVTWLTKGTDRIWLASAGALLLLSLMLVGPLTEYGCRVASDRFQSWSSQTRAGTMLHSVWELGRSKHLKPALVRRLLLISILRFVVVVLMTAQTAHMIGARIPLWQLAAAVPFVVVTTVIAVTPGGLGVNEMTYAMTLKLFGTPLGVATDWALANRILASAACFLLAACSLVVLVGRRPLARLRNSAG